MGVRALCFARPDGPGWGRVQRVSGDWARLGRGRYAAAATRGRGARAATVCAADGPRSTRRALHSDYIYMCYYCNVSM